jgi:DNA polymerase I
VIPKLNGKRDIDEVPAEELKPGDEIFVLRRFPLSVSPPDSLFIPEIIDDGCGLIDFHGTSPVRIRSIEKESDERPVFDLETGNGWFVTGNGIVVHNSYGVLGSYNFPMFCVAAAESVTAVGRHSIREMMDYAEGLNVKVLYGDTDSVFLENPSPEAVASIAETADKRFHIDLEIDKEYRYAGFSDLKKNYFGVTNDGKVDVKGLTGKKKNTPPFAREAFSKSTGLLGAVTTPDELEVVKMKIRKNIRVVMKALKGGKILPDKLAFRVTLGQNPGDYKGKTKPQYARAALMLMKEKGVKIAAGDFVDFVKVGRNDVLPVDLFIENRKKIAELKEKAEKAGTGTAAGKKLLLTAKTEEILLNLLKYTESLETVFDQLIDPLGLSFQEVTTGASLAAFMGGGKKS